MTISEKDYKELKEYWDYQRKVEYNREKVYHMAERIAANTYTEFGRLPIDEVQSILWSKIESKNVYDLIHYLSSQYKIFRNLVKLRKLKNRLLRKIQLSLTY